MRQDQRVTETILVAVAWPYANGSLHHGQLGGAYLPADIFARYHRTKGNRVVMVSGSDTHGTPITVRAEQEGRSPQEVVDGFHAEFLETWKGIGISFDLFTSTRTENHQAVVHDLFLRLLQAGYLYTATQTLPFDPPRKSSSPTATSRGPVPTALMNSPAATSATTAAANSTPPISSIPAANSPVPLPFNGRASTSS